MLSFLNKMIPSMVFAGVFSGMLIWITWKMIHDTVVSQLGRFVLLLSFSFFFTELFISLNARLAYVFVVVKTSIISVCFGMLTFVMVKHTSDFVHILWITLLCSVISLIIQKSIDRARLGINRALAFSCILTVGFVGNFLLLELSLNEFNRDNQGLLVVGGFLHPLIRTASLLAVLRLLRAYTSGDRDALPMITKLMYLLYGVPGKVLVYSIPSQDMAATAMVLAACTEMVARAIYVAMLRVCERKINTGLRDFFREWSRESTVMFCNAQWASYTGHFSAAVAAAVGFLNHPALIMPRFLTGMTIELCSDAVTYIVEWGLGGHAWRYKYLGVTQRHVVSITFAAAAVGIFCAAVALAYPAV